MKKVMIAGLVVLSLLLAACGNTTNRGSSSNNKNDDEAKGNTVVEKNDDELLDCCDGDNDRIIPIAGGGGQLPIGVDVTIASFVEGLSADTYPDLEMTAVVLERMAILPGAVFRVNITLTNHGDKTVAYTQGSGMNVIPDALFMTSESLQVILPEDRMGISTDDFVVAPIEPGESVSFDWYVLAVEPNAQFNESASLLYMQEGIYIATLSPEEIAESIPGLVPVAPGQYNVEVAFRFRVQENTDGEELAFLFSEDSSYVTATLTVGISE